MSSVCTAECTFRARGLAVHDARLGQVRGSIVRAAWLGRDTCAHDGRVHISGTWLGGRFMMRGSVVRVARLGRDTCAHGRVHGSVATHELVALERMHG